MAGVALYWFELTATDPQQALWRSWLSPEERARADRYRNPAHGERYFAAHARLRWLLAQALDCHPGELRFARDGNGKPILAGAALHFNLSHSGTLGLVGLHPACALGVDIEAERPRNFLALAGRFFTPAEQAWLAAQPEPQRAHAFARLWTAKEAWMKADGRGLAVLRQPEIQVDERGLSRLRALGRPWWLHELDIAPGYAASVVLPAAPDNLTVTRALPPPPA